MKVNLTTLTLDQLRLIANNQRVYSGKVNSDLVEEIKKRESNGESVSYTHLTLPTSDLV